MSGIPPATDGQDREEARALASAFRFVRDLFRPPGAEQWEFLRSKETWGAWTDLAARLGLSGPAPLPRSAREYETQYIETFEVGAPHPHVPLIESHYLRRDPVPRILHENILFYAAFGLRLSAGSEETSDHLRHQLDFLGYLCEREAAETDSERLEQIRRARSEYLERHVASWVGLAAGKAADCPYPCLRDLLSLLVAVVDAAGGRLPAPAEEPER
ncbi:MAG: molecular chaperone TorD family protein [Candidatus Eisenbacteria bacterium]|nr:molecular chaperone TorD family protein [Candidatus Eisenbacteria bacterium]